MQKNLKNIKEIIIRKLGKKITLDNFYKMSKIIELLYGFLREFTL